jgi:hypothetical protein
MVLRFLTPWSISPLTSRSSTLLTMEHCRNSAEVAVKVLKFIARAVKEEKKRLTLSHSLLNNSIFGVAHIV